MGAGISRHSLQSHFEVCELTGHMSNPFGEEKEESSDHPDIFVCRGLRQPWPEFWKEFQYFG